MGSNALNALQGKAFSERSEDFDPDSIAEFHVGEPGEMGVRVVDNCAEEHIM